MKNLMIDFLRDIRSIQKKHKKLQRIIKATPTNILLNKHFAQNNIEKCFAQNKVIGTSNENIKRIIAAYKKAKAVQSAKQAAYQVGNEWLPLYEKYMGTITKALLNEDIASVKSIYENFMREDCSVGLHGMPDDMHKSYFNGNIKPINKDLYLYDSIYRYEHWQELTKSNYAVADLQMPLYGNAYGYFINGNFIRTGAEYLHYYAQAIKQLLKDRNEQKIVVELGGGYGGLAYFINKNLENKKYIDFDLPENLALTAYYLLSCFPDKKIALYGEMDSGNYSVEDYDILLLPNFEIEVLQPNSVDLVFNSYSLAEMSKETIDTYIKFLATASRSYFYHVNHNKVSYSYIADDFGIENYDFKLVSKTKALWNMGRNSEMDEFEYLYTK